jgi:hypothetical protein
MFKIISPFEKQEMKMFLKPNDKESYRKRMKVINSGILKINNNAIKICMEKSSKREVSRRCSHRNSWVYWPFISSTFVRIGKVS